MLTNEQLRQILIDVCDGNISAWARAHGLYSQRGNISEMMRGQREITEKIGKALGYKKERFWIKR